MELKTIYQPVKEELAGVERNLEAVSNAETPFLTRLLEHVLKNGGKRLRPALTLLAGKLYQPDSNLSVPMATGVELLHTATLVHDDIVDRSRMRRGKETVYAAWGGTRAVLLGDYLFAQAAAFVANTENIRAVKLFAQTLNTLSSGELEESVTILSLKRMRHHYYHWIGAKTACLFSASAEAGAILSPQATEADIKALHNYGYHLGMAFQIMDDILDFTGEETEMGKPVVVDLSQGVLTLPAIIFLENHPEMLAAKDILEADSIKNLISSVNQIRQPSVIQECLEVASDFCARALDALENLPDNVCRRALGDIVKYAVERRA